MANTHKEILMTYLTEKRCDLESKITDKQHMVFKYDADVVNTLELQLALNKLDCFNEFADDVAKLMELSHFESLFTYIAVNPEYVRYRLSQFA